MFQKVCDVIGLVAGTLLLGLVVFNFLFYDKQPSNFEVMLVLIAAIQINRHDD